MSPPLNDRITAAQALPQPDKIDRTRRTLLFGAALTAGMAGAGLRPAHAVAGRRPPRFGIDRSARVSAARLDAEVAKAFPLFNARRSCRRSMPPAPARSSTSICTGS